MLNMSNMHIFDIICYVYMQNKSKLDTRNKKAIFMGNDKGAFFYIFQNRNK